MWLSTGSLSDRRSGPLGIPLATNLSSSAMPAGQQTLPRLMSGETDVVAVTQGHHNAGETAISGGKADSLLDSRPKLPA